MTKDLDQKVAHAMWLKSVNNCEKWGTSMDVDKLLVEAGAYFAGDGVNYDRFEPRKFANLVAKHTLLNIDPSKFMSCQEVMEAARLAEREACAKVCEDLVPTYLKDGERWLKGRNGKPDSRLKDLAPNLEAAWEAEQLLKHGSVVQKITEGHICANAIRARGQA